MRKLTSSEQDFLRLILRQSQEAAPYVSCLSDCQVEELSDGGMGGLKFCSDQDGRVLGKDLASLSFEDVDGVLVVATLSLDQFGALFELDVWKTNFSPLLQFPCP